MARTVKLKELPELGLSEPNMLHVQESYLRQVTHAKPFTAKKQRRSDVTATGAKWYRQKGTGRARQGPRTNPHMRGGGLAFPPRPRAPRKGLNKHVRRSGLHSAVLCHVLHESAFVIQGKEFDDIAKTKDVAAILDKITGNGMVCLVLSRGSIAWRSSRNISYVRLVTPEHVNVRDLVECECLVFAQSALENYKEQLKKWVEPAGEAVTPPAEDSLDDEKQASSKKAKQDDDKGSGGKE